MIRQVNTGTYALREFKEFSNSDKEKIAHVVESQSNEMLLSPVVTDFVYASSRALDYGDRFGSIDGRALWEHAINKNHDYFDVLVLNEEHPNLKLPRYMTFKTARMHLDHDSKNAANSIGLVFDVYDVKDNYEDMHLALLFGIDKQKAPKIARELMTHPDRVPTSMGCNITGVVCTACLEPGCDHLKYMKGGRVGGKKVAEYLLGPEFFEDSIVTVPACHTAYVIDAISDIVPGRLLKIAAMSDETTITAQIIMGIRESIKSAKDHSAKIRLANQLDIYIDRLTTLMEQNQYAT
jgi:hypothetical protein